MSITIEWDTEEKTALLFTYQGSWTTQEFSAIITQSNQMMSEVDHKVNVILDVRKSRALPANFISVIRAMPGRASNKTGNIAIVGANSFIQAISKTITRLFGDKIPQAVVMCDTPEEARASFASSTAKEVNLANRQVG